MKRTIYYIAVFCLIVTFAKSAQAKTPLKPASFLPSETLLLIEVEDCNTLQKQFEKTSFYKLYKDPAMAAFFDKTISAFKEKTRKGKNEIAKAIIDAGIWPEGTLAAALVLSNQKTDDEEPQMLLISQWGQNLSKIKDALNKTIKEKLEEGAYQKSDKYRDCDIITITKELPPKKVRDFEKYSPELNDVPMKTIPQTEKFSYCFIDDCMLAGNDAELLKFAVANIKGAGNPTLKDDVDYGATLAAIGPWKDICLYVNIKQLIKTAIAQDTSEQAVKYIRSLGVENVSSLGVSLSAARGAGNNLECKGLLKINGTKTGICKMLEPENTTFNVPPFISPSTYTITNINLDIKKAYSELYTILYGINPIFAGMMNTPLSTASSPNESGLQLKSDIIEHLGSQIVIAQTANKPFTKTGEPTDTIFAFSVNNHDAIEKSLALVHSKLLAQGNPDAKKELMGHTIYLVNSHALQSLLPGPRPMQNLSENPAQPSSTAAFTVTDTHLIFGSQSAVENAVRSLSGASAESLRTEKWFIFAKSEVPPVAALTALENYQTSAEILWWLAKQTGRVDGGDIATASNIALGVSPMSKEFFDFSLLPEFDTVRKYFGVSAGHILSRPDGFFFESKVIDNP